VPTPTARRSFYEKHLVDGEDDATTAAPGSICEVDKLFTDAMGDAKKQMKRPLAFTQKAWNTSKNVYPSLITLINEYVSAISQSTVDKDGVHLT
jgi:hypothetical protein